MKYSISNKSNLDMNQMRPLLKSFMPFAQKKMGFDQPVRINFTSDSQNAANPLGKTAFYDPNSSAVTIYADQRHPKDIMRSISHELVHHTQNCRGEFDKKPEMGEDYFQYNSYMREMEREAYEKGNMCFRDWEEKYRNQLQESIYYKTGDTKMNHKDWKNQAIFGRLMESFGYEAPEEEKEGEEVVEEGEEPLTELTDEERTNIEWYGDPRGNAPAPGSTPEWYASQGIRDPGPIRPYRGAPDPPARPVNRASEEAGLGDIYRAQDRRENIELEETKELEEGEEVVEGCVAPADGREDAGVYVGLAESQVRELVRRAFKKAFNK